MSNSNHEILLKNGEKVLIRQLSADDASAFHDFAGKLFASTEFVLHTPEEFKKKTIDETRQRLSPPPEKMSFNFGAFSATNPEQIIGNIEFSSSALLKMKHVGVIGMGILKPYRGLGLGTALMLHLLKKQICSLKLSALNSKFLPVITRALRFIKKWGLSWKANADRPSGSPMAAMTIA